MPLPSSPARFLRTLRPHRHAWWITLAAFAIGLLLFGLVWQKDRSRSASELATVAPVADDPVFQPLPEPKPADADGASEMQSAPSEDPESVQWTEVPSAPAQTPEIPISEPTTAMPASEPQPLPTSITSSPLPLPGQSPAPEYPARALRRGEGGTVRVQVEVDADGKPRRVSVLERSGSRQLDRAAVSGVRRWRFQPARRDGQPVPGTAVVPIDFDPRAGAESR